MSKIILHFGLLVFFLSLLFFSQQNIPIQDVLIKSFAIFIVITLMSGILVIVFFRSINKMLYKKAMNKEDSFIIGNQQNEQ